jgi:acyl-CoA thioester hydrolase
MTELTTEPFVWPLRVYFEDTDVVGVVYHARYLHFFERARTELLRFHGITMTELKDVHNLTWLVLEMNVKFKKAAKLDDELLVSAQLVWVKGVRQGFQQHITRKADGVRVAEADVTVVLLHADSLKPARMPAWMMAELN